MLTKRFLACQEAHVFSLPFATIAYSTTPKDIRQLKSFEQQRKTCWQMFSMCNVPLIALYRFLTQVGKALQYIKPFYTFCKKIKPVLRIISIFLLICLAFMKISQASDAGSLDKVSAVNIVLFICWSWTVHSVYLILNGLASFVLRLGVEEAKCIVILASQKSVAIGIAIVGYLPAEFGDQGLMAIPLVLSHLSMILFDACVISIWLKISPMEEEEDEEKPLLKNAIISGYTEPDGSINPAFQEDEDPQPKA